MYQAGTLSALVLLVCSPVQEGCGSAIIARAHALELRGRWAEAEALLFRSLRDRRICTGTARARALQRLGTVIRLNERVEQAIPVLSEALEMARTLGDPRLLGDATYALGDAHYIDAVYRFGGNRDGAAELIRESIGWRERARDQAGLAQSLYRYGTYLENARGDSDAARPYFERGLAAARASQDDRQIANNLTHLAVSRAKEGALREALSLHQGALRLAEARRHAYGLAFYHSNVGQAHAAVGELSLARRHLLAGVAVNKRLGFRLGLARSLAMLAELDATSGRMDAARAGFARSIAIAQQGGLPLLVLEGWLAIVDLESQRSRHRAWRAALEIAAGVARKHNQNDRLESIQSRLDAGFKPALPS